MSQQQKLERVLDLLLSEDQDQAAELLHQIIVEKARTIYESIVVDEDFDIAEADVVGGDPEEDFTAEISADEDEIESDEEADGEPEAMDDESDEESDEESDDEEIEDRVEDLESQLAELRAEFDALMGEELMEPNHADLADKVDAEAGEMDDGMGEFDFSDEEDVTEMYEKKDDEKLEKAPEAKDSKKDKKVDEETQFLSKVADTGQKGSAKLVGTGKNSPHGAENNKSPYTHAPSKTDFGGKPVKIGSGTGGEYGKYNGETAKDDTPSDNVDVKPKSSSVKADATPKFTGGKSAGEGFTKSPLTKKPA